VEEQSGRHDVPACNLASTFSKPLKDFDSLSKAFNRVMYRGVESDYEGIVPIILKPDAEGKIHGVKFIAVARDAASLSRLEKRYESIVRKLQA
jgi:hypothetical protein